MNNNPKFINEESISKAVYNLAIINLIKKQQSKLASLRATRFSELVCSVSHEQLLWNGIGEYLPKCQVH